MKIKIGDKFKSKNGLTGTVKNIKGKPKIEVRNKSGKVTQSIPVDDVDLSKFEKIINAQ